MTTSPLHQRRSGRRIARGLSIAVLAAVIGVTLTTAPQAHANPSIPGSVSPVEGSAFVPMYFDNTLERVDLSTGKVTARIPVGIKPIVTKYSKVSKKLYVGNFGLVNLNDKSPHGLYEQHISVVDPATNKEIKRIETHGAPYAVSQLSANGRYLYVPTLLSVVDVIDTMTNTIVRTIPVVLPPSPAHLEVSPKGDRFYIFSANGSVTAYNSRTGAVLGIPLQVIGLFPGWGALSADGATMYTINYFGGISMIDTKRWVVTRNIITPLSTAPLSATLTPDGSELWVANIGDNTIVIYDAATGERKDSIRSISPVSYVGFSGDGRTAYASNLGMGSNLKINTLGLATLSLASSGPRWPGSIDVYDTATRTKERRIPVGAVPVAGIY